MDVNGPSMAKAVAFFFQNIYNTLYIPISRTYEAKLG